jgi:hypothetical protein
LVRRTVRFGLNLGWRRQRAFAAPAVVRGGSELNELASPAAHNFARRDTR